MKRIVLYIALIACGICHAQEIPQISLTYDELSSDSFNDGTLTLKEGEENTTYNIKIRRRGAISQSYDKPSYAIKLVNELGDKLNASLLGMRDDNYWILDAMAPDKARMRNRVSMDLWLAFSHRPWYNDLEPKCINGYNGRFVEIYVNNTCQGIYCLSERVDRKQLKLKKYSEKQGIRGALYNTITWAGTASFKAPQTTPDNQNSTWDAWELKYPDIKDEEPITWQPLYDLLTFVNESDPETFSDEIENRIDLPVYIDYILFCQLISARDNTAKNVYLSFYDINNEKALFTPWDLDHSWGRQYNGSIEATTTILFEGNNLTDRLYTDFPDFENIVNTRWAELRETYFNIEYIDNIFAQYFTLFSENNADMTEKEIWNNHNSLSINISDEQEYIHNWTIERLQFLDRLYNYISEQEPTKVTSHHLNNNPGNKKIDNGQLLIIKDGIRFDLRGRRIPDGQ